MYPAQYLRDATARLVVLVALLVVALGVLAYGLTTAFVTIAEETGPPPVNPRVYVPHNAASYPLGIPPTFGG
jgi:hypothetical protein